MPWRPGSGVPPPRLLRRVLVAVCVGLAFVAVGASSVRAETRYAQLDQVASTMAMRPITVRCRTKDEDGMLSNAWGYTYLSWSKVVVDSRLCAAAAGDEVGFRTLAGPDADWLSFQALGIKTVVHESFHARHWRWRGDEGRVECQAIRHTFVAAQLLGRTGVEADALMPYALFWFWQTYEQIDGYKYSGCVVPFWLPPDDR